VREYDLIADWYSNERIDQTGVPEASALSATLSPASLVLDVGCGNGVPITRALLDAGHHIVGLDSSAAMLDRFRGNLPRTPAVRAIVEYAPFADASFDVSQPTRRPEKTLAWKWTDVVTLVRAAVVASVDRGTSAVGSACDESCRSRGGYPSSSARCSCNTKRATDDFRLSPAHVLEEGARIDL